MNIFTQLLRSLYSPKDMASYRFQGIGKTIGFVFLLMFISSAFIGTRLGFDIVNWVSITEERIQNEVPDFQLINGTLSSSVDHPIINEHPDFTFIFDTTGQITENDVNKYENALALLQEKTILVSYYTPQSFVYSSVENLKMTKEDVIHMIDFLNNLLWIVLPLLFLIMYIFNTALKFIGISFLALIGLILKKQIKKSIQYRHLWVISAYSVTIPTIFFAITNALQIIIPFSFLLYWLISTTLLYLVLKETTLEDEA